MAIKAIVVDDANVRHLIIGLNRDNVDSILRGEVVSFPTGYLEQLTEDSDLVVLFAETDDDLAKRFPPNLRPTWGGRKHRKPPQT